MTSGWDASSNLRDTTVTLSQHHGGLRLAFSSETGRDGWEGGSGGTQPPLFSRRGGASGGQAEPRPAPPSPPRDGLETGLIAEGCLVPAGGGGVANGFSLPSRDTSLPPAVSNRSPAGCFIRAAPVTSVKCRAWFCCCDTSPPLKSPSCTSLKESSHFKALLNRQIGFFKVHLFCRVCKYV